MSTQVKVVKSNYNFQKYLWTFKHKLYFILRICILGKFINLFTFVVVAVVGIVSVSVTLLLPLKLDAEFMIPLKSE